MKASTVDKASGLPHLDKSAIPYGFMLQLLSHIVYVHVHTIFDCLNAGLKLTPGLKESLETRHKTRNKAEVNPLTGEYIWAQQLTMFKWSQQVYT